MIGVLCTLSNICVKRKRVFQHGLLMIVICLGLYVRVYNSWQMYLNLYPYKTFMTNGYRVGDYSWIHYEYDHNYDRDKFHRPALWVFGDDGINVNGNDNGNFE